MASVVVGQLILVWAASRLAARLDMRRLGRGRDGPSLAQASHHRNNSLLRGLVLGTFVVDVALTNWYDLINSIEFVAAVPALPDLLAIMPFLLGSIILLVVVYPVDRALRATTVEAQLWQQGTPHKVWSLREYLAFNVRHHLLAVAAPMGLILVAYDFTRDREEALTRWIPVPWLPDAVLGLVAAIVFIFAPILLTRIWTTHPLPDGPLRRSLLEMCDRIGLRCRDILVWRSGGMTVNAAVMGLFPSIRYIMLSDALIEEMNEDQIEAVFGHEAGHVHHLHIPLFLLFALASMLISAGAMELLYRASDSPDAPAYLNVETIQAVGFLLIVALWGLGFGFVSRRFERQADLYGARCVSPQDASECRRPCGAHHVSGASPAANALCATGADVFVSSLERVADLNGIPPDEPSWRHSSIASRIRFLRRLASDPLSVARFDRLIRRIRVSLLTVCIVGTAVSAYYAWPFVFGKTAVKSVRKSTVGSVIRVRPNPGR